MKRKKEHDFHDIFSYEMYVDRLARALIPFAEEPTDEMNDYFCHRGICSKEECHRCSSAIEAWNALHDIK